MKNPKLANEVIQFIKTNKQDNENFNKLALKIFKYQYNNSKRYKRFCDSHNKTPSNITSFKQIPPVPASAFKKFKITPLTDNEIGKTYKTSGTTSGISGEVHLDNNALKVSKASILTNAKNFLFPDLKENEKIQIMLLVPPITLAPNMIMANGMDTIKNKFGNSKSKYYITKEGLDGKAFVKDLKTAEANKTPVALIGGSFGFVNFFDFCLKNRTKFNLTKGSRMMDAGGYKGRSREISSIEYLNELKKYFNISKEYRINLLGMTELNSQFYDNSLKNNLLNRKATTSKENPPWTNTEVVSIDTLQPLEAPKTKGLLVHTDLANLTTPIRILAEDVGFRTQTGFIMTRRTKGAELRGCGIKMEEVKIK